MCFFLLLTLSFRSDGMDFNHHRLINLSISVHLHTQNKGKFHCQHYLDLFHQPCLISSFVNVYSWLHYYHLHHHVRASSEHRVMWTVPYRVLPPAKQSFDAEHGQSDADTQLQENQHDHSDVCGCQHTLKQTRKKQQNKKDLTRMMWLKHWIVPDDTD